MIDINKLLEHAENVLDKNRKINDTVKCLLSHFSEESENHQHLDAEMMHTAYEAGRLEERQRMQTAEALSELAENDADEIVNNSTTKENT